MRRRLAALLVSLLVGALAAAACADEARSPRELCAEEMRGECCEDSECAAGSLCDFDYICAPGPDGVSCSEGSGDRLCHAECDAADEGEACADGLGTCERVERFQGGDAGREAYLCR